MDKQWRKSRSSCQFFLSEYAYIINRNTAQREKWQPWQYQLDLINIFLEYKDIVLVKARQIGWSWLLSGYADWKVLFNNAARGLFTSQGQSEAFDLIAKCKYIWRNLPDYLRIEQNHSESRELFDFKCSDSEIKALPSTVKAGRSTDATFVIRDELASHEYGAEDFRAIGPTIDSGGQLIDCSTIDKTDADNHFTERVHRALLGAERHDLPSGLVVFTGGESKAVLCFGGWNIRPVREENLSLNEWFDLRVKPKYSAFDIEQEYPKTIEDVLRQPQVRAMFDIKATEDMLLHVCDPLFGGHNIDTHNGMVKIYKPPVVGEKYIVFTDPSDGMDDPFHTVVMHARTYEGVAEAYGKVKADTCAKLHDELVRAYNNAYNSWEANASAGGKVEESIKGLETPTIAPRRDMQTGNVIKDKLGWWTSPVSRKTMLWALEEAIRQHLIISHNKDTIQQFQSMFVPEGGIPQVPKGLHDDAIIAWAGAWQLRKYAPTQGIQFSSFKYLA